MPLYTPAASSGPCAVVWTTFYLRMDLKAPSHSISLIGGPNVSSPSSVLSHSLALREHNTSITFVNSAGVGLASNDELAHDLPCLYTQLPCARWHWCDNPHVTDDMEDPRTAIHDWRVTSSSIDDILASSIHRGALVSSIHGRTMSLDQ